MQITEELDKELLETMTISRLVKTGLFKKLFVPNEEIRRELFLYRSVLDKALLDFFGEDKNYRFQAKLWMDLNNPSFCELCELALLEPENVHAIFVKVQEIFIRNKEDQYSCEDLKEISTLSESEKLAYLVYEEPDFDAPKNKQ